MVRISSSPKSKPLNRSLDYKGNFCPFFVVYQVGRHLQSWYAWRACKWAPKMCDMWSVSHQEMLKMPNWMVLFKVRTLWNETQFCFKPLDRWFHFWVVLRVHCSVTIQGGEWGSSWRGTTEKGARLRWKFLSCEIPRRLQKLRFSWTSSTLSPKLENLGIARNHASCPIIVLSFNVLM